MVNSYTHNSILKSQLNNPRKELLPMLPGGSYNGPLTV
jgi:hypothetical protein